MKGRGGGSNDFSTKNQAPDAGVGPEFSEKIRRLRLGAGFVA